MDERQLNVYLEFAKQLADSAGEIMRKYFQTTETEWKSDNTPLTQADTEINSMVVQRVAEAYPDHSVLGEEESANLGQKYTWVCDPIDGTIPYSHGIPVSSFSLALCEDGRPVLGVVYDPFVDRLFYASSGQGAFCNDEPIRVNDNGFENSLMNLEDVASKRNVVRLDPGLRKALYDRKTKVVTYNSTTLPTTMVASGQFTAAIFNFSKPEDGAAAKVIVEEAGGKFTSMYGEDQRYDGPVKGYVASNGKIHDELMQIIKEHDSEV